MPKPENKHLFKPVHIEALIFVILYFLLSVFVVVRAVANPNIIISFLASFSFGIISVFIFLYFFSHPDFFHFFKKLETFESKKEKQYLGDYKQYGKYLACLLISIIAGQIFLALSIRFLFPKSAHRYWISVFITLASTLVVIFFGKSILGIFVR